VRAAFVSDDDIREMAAMWTGRQLPAVPTLPAGQAE
jgi:hypothetical protein